jgi:Ca-activated chloride channel family protein
MSVLLPSKLTKPSNRKGASDNIRFAGAVAAFGQLLRGGKYIGAFGYEDVIGLAQSARGEDEHGYRAEFVSLVEIAKSIEVPKEN